MSALPKPIHDLIEAFSSLPGIGPKSASRLTFYLLARPKEEIDRLAGAIKHLTSDLVTCTQCFNVADSNPCSIDSDPKRDSSLLMVVEEPLDVLAMERTGYHGRYFVLGGVISPVEGVSPEDLRVTQLLERLEKDELVNEIILATDPSLEGEATAMYLSRELNRVKKEGRVRRLSVTRIARGLPVGGDLEYADEVTLTRALEGRKEY